MLYNYPTLGAKRTAAMLVDRSPQDVAAHVNMHGVYRQWAVAA